MRQDSLEHPGVLFPPPLLFALGFCFGWLLNRAYPLAIVPGGPTLASEIAGWLFIALGLGIAAWGAFTFRRHNTAVLPMRPASKLVTGGPYRFSRNPMYVGLTTAYVGLVLLTNMLWSLVFLPLVLVALLYAVIFREERYLVGAFDSQYREYTRRVRRWI